MTAARVNRLLDSLPRTTVWRAVRPVPVFRTAGVVGFHVAVVVALGIGLIRGLSPLVLVAMAAVSGLSFFAFAYPRKWLTGHEDIVLLEHVWFTLASVAGLLWATGQPILPYLDVLCVVFPLFLAAGRTGCFLVGCCHGKPASIGVCYGAEHVRAGFPGWLAGVRVFPVQLVEAAGLLLIAAVAVVAIAFAGPGRTFEWFLVGYAVMRFGLEAIRGDQRPSFLGLSQARWMGIAEVALVVWLELGSVAAFRDPATTALAAIPVAVLVLGLVHLARRHGARLSHATHVAELRELVASALDEGPTEDAPAIVETSRGLRAGLTAADAETSAHISISDPSGRGLEELCLTVGGALPETIPSTAFVSPRGILHVDLALLRDSSVTDDRHGLELWGAVLRRTEDLEAPAATEATPPDTEASPVQARSSYFRHVG